jgi:hypothetical protein
MLKLHVAWSQEPCEILYAGLATVPLTDVKANGFERKRWNDGKKQMKTTRQCRMKNLGR